MAPGRTPAREVEHSATVSRAETLLLALARDLAADVHEASGPSPAAVLTAVAGRYGPGSPLARALLETGRRAQGDERLALALAWAREHVRLALEDLVQGAGDRAAPAPVPVPPATLAWLLLAGLEALALEPGGAVADRVQALVALLGGSASSGSDATGLASAGGAEASAVMSQGSRGRTGADPAHDPVGRVAPRGPTSRRAGARAVAPVPRRRGGPTRPAGKTSAGSPPRARRGLAVHPVDRPATEA